MKCKKCKAQIPNISAFCPNCGERTSKKQKKSIFNRKCPKCSLIIKTTKIDYCPNCLIELNKVRA